MIRRRLWLTALILTTPLAATFVQESAHAYDSAGPDIAASTHNQATPLAPWPFGNFYFQNPADMNPVDMTGDQFSALFGGGGVGEGPYSTKSSRARGVMNYSARIIHGVHGGNPGSPDDGVIVGIYRCPWDFATTRDWSGCVPWDPKDAREMPGWVKTHRGWDTRHHDASSDVAAPEHMDMLMEAARVAGLDRTALFAETIWTRYPVADSWITTPIKGDVQWAASAVVAPSWKPVSFLEMRAQANRGFKLAELAQMPDVASTVWDWAAGGEVCPLSGISENPGHVLPGDVSAFGNPANDSNACHDFGRVMGATNAAHFLPLSKRTYQHYHRLAQSAMERCSALEAKLRPIYLLQSNGTPAFHGPNDSEVDVCVAEAMTFEMMAQHFLQDAWATGHMWYRWGYPDLQPFPSSLTTLPGKGIPVQNIPARRFVLAGTVASYAGTVHGSKGVTGKLLPPWASGLLNDPLCGPRYYSPFLSNGSLRDSLVQWTSAGAAPANGVGDLFWDSTTASVKAGSEYTEQRKRVLGCSARSLLDVYSKGPFSAVTAPSGTGVDLSDPNLAPAQFDSYCFGQLATNDSMNGALGALYLSRNLDFVQPPWPGNPVTRAALFSFINTILVGQRANQVAFPDAVDGNAFVESLALKLSSEVNNLGGVFAAAALVNPKGTDSAQLIGADKLPLTLLGTPPNADPGAGVKPATYVDEASPRGNATDYPQDHYVRRMFWRAHLEDVCDDGTIVRTLRNRCIAGAAVGGDPEACTACVDIAESHVPTCAVTGGTGLIGASKCAAVGGPIASGLPPAWFDGQGRFQSTSCGNAPHYWLAMSYCTGTTPSRWSASYGQTDLQEIGSTTSACNPARKLPAVRERVAIARVEMNDRHQTTRPIVTAFEQVRTYKETTDCTPYSTTDRDSDLEKILGLPVWEDALRSKPLIIADDTLVGLDPYKLPMCGMTQRVSWWNRDCATVLGLPTLAVPPNATGTQKFNPATGYEAFSLSDVPPYQNEQRCSLREIRQFTPSCESPLSVCNSSGLCVPARDPSGTPIPASPGPLPVLNLP